MGSEGPAEIAIGPAHFFSDTSAGKLLETSRKSMAEKIEAANVFKVNWRKDIRGYRCAKPLFDHLEAQGFWIWPDEPTPEDLEQSCCWGGMSHLL
jgi:hypothetical protein